MEAPVGLSEVIARSHFGLSIAYCIAASPTLLLVTLSFICSLTAGFRGDFWSISPACAAAFIAVWPTLAQSSPVPGN